MIMRILQLCPQFPFPPTDGGKIGMLSITKSLVENGAHVHVLCLSKTIPSEKDTQGFKEYTGAEIACIQHNTTNTIFSIFLSLFNATYPLYITKHRSAHFHHAIEDLLKKCTFDGIFCDHSCMIESALWAATKQKGIPVFARLHNIEYKIWERYAERLSKFNPIHWYIASQAKKLRLFEARHYDKVSLCYAITNHDAMIAKNMSPQASISTLTAGVHINELIPDNTIEKNPHRMIHASTFDWIHNREALYWFLKEVFPAIKSHISNAELVVLGKHIPEDILTMKNQDILAKGFVPSIVPEYSAASFFIAPLFVGSGIRIKILEAMSLGLPVIASSIAAEGILATQDQGLIICDNAEDFAKQSVFLLNNPHITIRLGLEARNYIVQNHSWDEIGKSILLDFQQLT
jgi:glycosyltransferase involved in cell wall biosynthesis